MQVGELVAPVKEEWGVGIVAGIHNDIAHVFFRNQPEKVAKKFRFPSLKPANAPNDPWVDMPPRFIEKDGQYTRTKEFESTESARRRFTERFPAGFQDETYINGKKAGERGYKTAGIELFASTLGDGKGQALIASGDVEQAVKLVKKVISKVGNLLVKSEAVAFNEGLADTTSAGKFLTALFELDETPSKETFDKYIEALRALPNDGDTDIDKWSIATLLPFLMYPNTYMFVKPTTVRKAADRSDIDIGYVSNPNWKTYANILKLAETTMADLAELEPADLIDIQSYYWVTGEQTSKSKAAAAV